MTRKTKILFIGIDAADKDLIFEWAGAGLLPNFQRLLDRGTWGITSNPVGFYVGAIWPSFATGVSVARHGCYCYSQLTPGSYKTRQYSVFELHRELFWDTLSRAGRRVAIIDLPRVRPSEALNGIQIVDWGTHDPDLPDSLYTWPPSLAAEVEAEFGRDPIGYCNAIARTPEGIDDFCNKLIDRAHKKADLSIKFLNQGGWDLFLTVFSESHCVGHQCWNLHDPTHPKYDPELAKAVGNPLQKVYIAIDAAIGRLLEQVGPETQVFVLASHGMGPHYDGTFLLDEMLRRLEGVQSSPLRQQTAKVLNSSWEQTPLLRYPLQLLRKLLWQPLRKLLWNTDTPLRTALSSPDLTGRKCFTLPNNDVYGGIRINLAGREPSGKIQPGAEYNAFCQQLTQDLREFTNADTGEPLVLRVLRAADYYRGEYLDHLPDLLVEWNRTAPISAVYSPKTGKIEKEFPGVRTGDHKPNGLVLTMGPSVKPGQIDRAIAIEDFAPTLANLLDVSLPDADGQAIPELVGIARANA